MKPNKSTARILTLRFMGVGLLKAILLWLFVINLGIAVGAGLYEAQDVIPQWADLPAKDLPNTGLLFWLYVTTVPLTLPAFANLVAAWLDKSVRRKRWLSAVFIVLIKRLAPFSYFIPAMNLTRSDLPDAEVTSRLSQWLFKSRASSSYTSGMVDGAQSIFYTDNIEVNHRKSANYNKKTRR